MRLDNENTGNGFHLVPETYGMDVPSACTIVIIAGIYCKCCPDKLLSSS